MKHLLLVLGTLLIHTLTVQPILAAQTNDNQASGILTRTATIQTSAVLISEIVVTPTAGEFIEIYNPNVAAVDLSNFYLTDATSESSAKYYYNPEYTKSIKMLLLK